MMSEREMYLRMAEWLREHGFTPSWGDADDCGCFIRATEEVDSAMEAGVPRKLMEVMGITSIREFGDDHLVRQGWTKGCTDDAVAACLIAADLAA